MFNITSKLEINVRPGPTLGTDMNQLPTFMMKSRIPVLICHPTILEGALIERAKTKATYKIYTTVDFEHGKRYAMDKFLDLPKAVFECDGLEILLTANRTDMESLNEMRALKEYTSRLNSLMEIRWVLGLRTRTYDSVANIMKHILKIPANIIRTDINVEVPAITTEDHQKDIDFIKKHVATPVKISGNITLDIIKTIKNVNKFDVSVIQAKRIVKVLIAENKAAKAPPKAEVKQEVKKAPKAPKETPKAVVKKPSLVSMQLEGKLGKDTEEKPKPRSRLALQEIAEDARVFKQLQEEAAKQQPKEEDSIEEISDA